ncbi:tetratricopeptide repeat protein [Bradyrhizobium zhanjiangense]|uniref:tetratricopeptide repeat protein n=1 Tax=Bradyrhizobium zhanjiangense TaxID=1325107 RepID=UPI00100925C2|nr:tetratricopeptide repeat protein [Bradyrhizobium zhanjiangense]
MILFRSLAVAVALPILFVLEASDASAQSKNPAGASISKLVVIEDPLILDSRLSDKGVTPQTVAEVLRFILSANPDTVATIGRAPPQAAPSTLFLASKIDRLGEATVWTGFARTSTSSPLRLGPVAILYENGLRFGSLNEISELVRAQFTNSLSDGTSAGLSLGCVKSTGQLGPRLQQDIFYRFQSRLVTVPGVHWQDLASDFCSDEAQEQFQNQWRIDGRIAADEAGISIEPQLSRLALRIPLVAYRGTSSTFRDDQGEYYDLLTRGVSAIINQYPADIVEIASSSRDAGIEVQSEQGLRFLGGNVPHLALRFLQRAATGNPNLNYELGTAFQSLTAPRQAERAFRMAIAGNPAHGLAHRDLGEILFKQEKYEEAAKEFERAGTTSGAAETYAQLLYSQGRRAEAREKAVSALKRGERSTDLQLLLARLDIGENKLTDAVERLSTQLAESHDGDGDRDRIVKLLKEAAATALTRGDLPTSEKALDALIERAPDPEVYLVRGRVALAKSKNNSFGSTKEAVLLFTKALETKKDKNIENPELDLVVLELAEALFLDGQYVQAAAKAASFFSTEYSRGQEEPRPDSKATTYRYIPVAALLQLSGQQVTRSSPVENALEALQRSLGKSPKKPELIVWVTGPNGREPVTVAQWSFATLRLYVCTQLGSKKRDEVAQLIDRFEEETGLEKTSCPTR